MKKIYSILAIIIVLALVFLGIREEAHPEVGFDTAKEAKIGFILPVTGDAASYGESAQKAAKLAMEDLGKQGVSITPIYEDSKLSGSVSAGLIQKFIEEGVLAVISFGSGDALAMCPIIKGHDIVLFNSGSSPEITACEQTFRNYPSDIYQGKILAEKAKENGFEKIALVYLNNDYGVGLKNEFIKNYSGTIAVTEVQAPGSTDFRTSLAKIKSSGATHIVLLSQLAEVIPFLNQYADQGMRLPILASESIKDDSLPRSVPKVIHGNISAIAVAEYSGSEAQEFKTAYEEAYGAKQTAFADHVYDNTITAGKAIDACNKKRMLNAACIQDFVERYNAIGATGPISFGSDGDILGKSYDVYVIKGGVYVKK